MNEAEDSTNGKETSTPEQIFAGYQIAIVTDSENVAAVLGKAFTNRGGKVIAFPNGKKAVEMSKSFHFDVLIVTDGLTQYDATFCAKALREQKVSDVDVMWYIGKEKIELMDGCLPRPFRPIELLRPIHEKLRQKRRPGVTSSESVAGGSFTQSPPATEKVATPSVAATEAPKAATEAPKAAAEAPKAAAEPPKVAAEVPQKEAAPIAAKNVTAKVSGKAARKILVVDDETHLREVTATILQSENYEVLTAENGMAAMEVIAEHKKIDVMLLDLKMPGFNGIQLLTALRNLGLGMDECHIIIVTAIQRPELVEAAKKLGVTHWLTKPFNPEILLDFIHKAPAAK